ncbi:MAG: hypothetical protein N2Z21_05030 [Candidatus Sumerlaeaceae bacterium]|nr:hypothetical protein [Candidatus Sumerlaeaceae bacterium]
MHLKEQRSLWLVTISAIAVAAGLLASHLTYNGLWIDEIYTLHAVNLPWREMFFERLMRGHFPLYFGLMKVWLALASSASETALRLPSLVFWMISTALFGWLAFRNLAKNTAPLSTLLFGLNGLALRQAGEARMYTLVLLFSVEICFAYLILSDGKNNKLAKISLICLPLIAFWCSSTVVLTISALTLDALRRRHREVLVLLGTSLALILTSALLPALTHVASRERSEIAHVPPLVLFLHLVTFLSGIVGWEDYYRLSSSAYALQAIGAIVTLLACAMLLRKWLKLSEQVRTSALVVFVPLILMLVTYILEKTVGLKVALHGPARYLIGSLPFAAVLSGSLFSQVFSRPHVTIAATGGWAAVLLLNAIIVVRLPVETPRELLQHYLGQRYLPSDAVAVVPTQAAEAVQMYVPQVRITQTIARNLGAEEIREKLATVGNADRLWLIWIHGKESKAIDVADSLFGKGISSSPKRYKGERRIFLYRPLMRKQQSCGGSTTDEFSASP